MRQQIEDFCKTLGLDTIGFMPCRRFEELVPFYEERKRTNLENEFEGKELEARIDPNSYMAEGKTIISIAFPYYHEEAADRVKNGFSIYTKRGDYHRVVKSYLDKVIAYIETLGGKGMAFVDSNNLPERYIAYLAGVGFIGKNNMLITRKYGSYVFLGEIITSLEIPCQEARRYKELKEHEECGACSRCLKTCPTKSINEGPCDPNRCLSYMTQKKELTDEEISLLKGNVFGCDFCQITCPYNKEATVNVLEAFKTLPDMEEEATIYAAMDNKFFKEKISGTSCGWRGKNVIKRNAIIRLAKQGEDITRFKGDSPYINEYIDRLKARQDNED